ncbi:MAG: histidine phosphatase family protein [Defluviitaleaceae bacterium]|nr:histidine phosphatase family protein [Defluviitaleaceae bacterium]
MLISFIRHGMTVANENKLYCGRTDPPLSKNGIRLLAAQKNETAYPEADIFVSSGLARADETLRVIYGRGPDIVMDDLREMDFGDFEMKSYDMLKDNPDYIRWILDAQNVACPNGESRNEFDARAAAGLKKLTELGYGSAVAVCHGGIVVSILESLFPGEKNFYEWQPGYGLGYTIDTDAKKWKLIGSRS